MNKIYLFLLLMFFFPLVACSLKMDSMSDILATEYSEQNIVPDGAENYYCDENKQFFLKFVDDDKGLWLIYPKRQLKLVLIDNKNLYSNGVTTLIKEANSVLVKDDSGILYNNCIEKKEN